MGKVFGLAVVTESCTKLALRLEPFGLPQRGNVIQPSVGRPAYAGLHVMNTTLTGLNPIAGKRYNPVGVETDFETVDPG